MSLDDPTPHIYRGRQAAVALDVLVIGGGIGGLAVAICLAEAGHNVLIFEAARRLREVGAGLQVSPNVTRLLYRWGLADALRTCAVAPEALVFRRYDSGEAVGRSRWGAAIADEYGAPYLHMHRADLHRILLARARACPRVAFRLAARVQSLDPVPDPKVAVALVSGDVFEGDLIIGADGVHSLARQVVCGRTDLAQHTGDAAYRATIPTHLMMDDPDLRALVETPELTTWMGPDRHIMAYCIRAKQEYNLVLCHPDDGGKESYTAEGNTEKMRTDFADFEPRVRKLLALVDVTLKWRLNSRMPLASWVHPDARVALLGDACHPMLPYRAQGAAMAIEDAAVLGNLLSRLAVLGPSAPTSKPHSPAALAAAHLPRLLHAYERLRLARATSTQETSALNRYVFHLPDGPEQRARDASMRRAMLAECAHDRALLLPPAAAAASPAAPHPRRNQANANQWADRRKNREQYAYDADAAVERWWAAEGAGQLRALVAAGAAGEKPAAGSPETSTLASSGSGSRGSGGRKPSFWRRLLGKRIDEE